MPRAALAAIISAKVMQKSPLRRVSGVGPTCLDAVAAYLLRRFGRFVGAWPIQDRQQLAKLGDTCPVVLKQA